MTVAIPGPRGGWKTESRKDWKQMFIGRPDSDEHLIPCSREPASLPPCPKLSGPQSVTMLMSDSKAIRQLCLSYADANVSSLISTGHVSFFCLFVCSFLSFIHQAIQFYAAGTRPQRGAACSRRPLLGWVAAGPLDSSQPLMFSCWLLRISSLI